ncbi:MAG: hypothetical protein HFH60_10270 [Lachnospiraceae bacterium]|nr:hypothetical protein [Lachnospiraceae bacterium]
MITIKDIITAASGKDEQGFNKSAIGLFYEKIDTEGNSTIINEVDVDKPFINIFKSLNRIQVDIIYSMKNDIDLKMMNDLLIRATDSGNSLEDNATEFPLITLSIIPHEFDGKFYILCTDPIVWCLTAQDPRGEIDTIRLVFDEEDFNILASDDDALAMLTAEIDQDLEAQARTEAFYAEKQASETER